LSLLHTPLFSTHQDLKANIVDFAGYAMPLHYGSQIEEHHAVRQAAGIFDVSHMGVVEITGARCVEYLRYVLANDVNKLVDGQALYTCLLNYEAGIIDDLIVYRCNPEYFRIVMNASRRVIDFAWFQLQAQAFGVNLNLREDVALLALQGPEALNRLDKMLGSDLKSQLKTFHFVMQTPHLPFEHMIARTGYTGEDGVEIILSAKEAATFWQRCMEAGFKPCGLAARDTLRMEAGLNLYGQDMDEQTHPLESNLAWTIAWQDEQRDFIGRSALSAIKQAGVQRALVGLILNDRGVMRHHQRVRTLKGEEGIITSGGYSPTLACSIALARLPVDCGPEVMVEIRQQLCSARVTKPVFVRKGKPV
jgi:aminomethyltransferase